MEARRTYSKMGHRLTLSDQDRTKSEEPTGYARFFALAFRNACIDELGHESSSRRNLYKSLGVSSRCFTISIMFRCGLCKNLTFDTQAALNVHSRAHFFCRLCDRNFVSKQALAAVNILLFLRTNGQ